MHPMRWTPQQALISIPLIVLAAGPLVFPKGALASRSPVAHDRVEQSLHYRLDRSYYRALAQKDAPPLPSLKAIAWEGATRRSLWDLLKDQRGAVAFVSGDATGTAAFSTTVTTSFAVAAGSDRYLALFNATRNTGTTCSGVTYNSVAFAAVSGAASAGASAPVNGKGWELVAPDVGTFNVVSTFNDANSSQNTHNVLYYTGVDQTTPSRTGAGSGVNGTSSSLTLTTVANDLCVHFFWISTASFHSFTAINSTVARTTELAARRGSDLLASGTSTTLGWTWTTSDVCRFVAWPMVPAAAAGGGGAPRLVGPPFRLAGQGGLAA